MIMFCLPTREQSLPLPIIVPISQVLKELFYHTTEHEAGPPQVLALQIGEGYAGFTISDKEGVHLYRVAYCTAEEWNESSLLSFFEKYNLSQQDFYKVQVAWNFSAAAFVPAKHFQFEEASTLLTGMYGLGMAGSVVAEPVAEWQLQTAYAVPGIIIESVMKRFPAARCRHLRTMLLKKLTSHTEGVLDVSFETDRFSVIAAKEGRLLLAETYAYSSPEDVLFYLLKACGVFGLSQQHVALQLSGLIDKQSALYRELHQYFIQVQFREADWGETAYPAHFFTSFNELAKCAS